MELELELELKLELELEVLSQCGLDNSDCDLIFADSTPMESAARQLAQL